MGRKSDITKYPDELIAYINKCVDENKHTYQEIVELVNALIIDKYMDENELSHASLGRYAKNRREDFERAVERMEQMKAHREELNSRIDIDNLDESGRFIMQMLMPSMYKMANVLSVIEDATPAEAFEHSKTIKNLSGSIVNIEKSLSENKSRNDQIKREATEAAKLEAVEAMESAAKGLDASEDVTKVLRKAIMQGLKNA